MKIRDLGEFDLIERISGRVKLSSRVVKGIGDDAAVLSYKKDKYLLFTSDMLVEGRHFYRRSGGYLIGKKALSVNVSDIAAMGGFPVSAVISLGVPGSLGLKYADELYRGIRAVAKRFKIDLVGGDTVSSKEIIINIALLGEVEKKNLVLRSGARKGDLIFLTGAIGDSSKGRHLGFMPRLKEARFLAKNFRVHSMIDVSDGLLADLGHILESSKVSGAVIHEKDIPVSKDAKDFNSAVIEGEDFELVFTVSQAEAKTLTKKWPFKTRLSRIGEVCRVKGLHLVRKTGTKTKVRPLGYTHF